VTCVCVCVCVDTQISSTKRCRVFRRAEKANIVVSFRVIRAFEKYRRPTLDKELNFVAKRTIKPTAQIVNMVLFVSSFFLTDRTYFRVSLRLLFSLLLLLLYLSDNTVHVDLGSRDHGTWPRGPRSVCREYASFIVVLPGPRAVVSMPKIVYQIRVPVGTTAFFNKTVDDDGTIAFARPNRENDNIANHKLC